MAMADGGWREVFTSFKYRPIITEQMDIAARENKALLVMGDANLCAVKWNEESFKNHELATKLKGLNV